MMNNGNRTVAFVTLGCKLNFSETSAIARQFSDAGYEKVPSSRPADIYVVNTCSVTEHADKKCRQTIRKLHKLNPDAIIAVTGCYAQLKPQEIMEIEGVDIVVGADRKGDVFQLVNRLPSKSLTARSFSCAIAQVETIFPAFSQGERTRSFLKVQDGCDYKCSYCTIPLARGKSRNLPVDMLVKEAEAIAAKGVLEIVLTGVNTGDFGRSTGEDFLDLLKSLDKVEGIRRYRISSVEPNLLREDIIRWIAEGTKFQPHFHIPLQSGSDKVLAAMRRRYNTGMFAEKIGMIRRLMGDVFLGIDVIAGFPGETEEEFENTYRFLSDVIRPAFLHVFPYSRRDGTPAAQMPGQVRESEKTRRVEELVRLSDRLHGEYVERFRGSRQQVLFESTQKGGLMFGYTGNYIRVERPYDREAIGKIMEVIL